MKKNICIIGLGYVGLPLAVLLAKKHNVVGFDISVDRVKALNSGFDSNLEIGRQQLEASSCVFTSNVDDCFDQEFYLVTVPTPVDKNKMPDLMPLREASAMVGSVISTGALVVYESTVYPGVTEDVCIPILEDCSGLTVGVDLEVGYSPERINPGDAAHSVENVVKLVAATSNTALTRLSELYGSVIPAGVHETPSIRCAEAAKALENTQRDVNIALMNEMAVMCDSLGIDVYDVITAAKTKWNFLSFTPGMVGGHCIAVDPQYLVHVGSGLGVPTDVISAGRRVNDSIPSYLATKLLKIMARKPTLRTGGRILMAGVAFKENCPDIRNSLVEHLVTTLESFGQKVDLLDPIVGAAGTTIVWGKEVLSAAEFAEYSVIVLAVPHAELVEYLTGWVESRDKEASVFFDVRAAFAASLSDGRL